MGTWLGYPSVSEISAPSPLLLPQFNPFHFDLITMDYSCCIHKCQNAHSEHDRSAMGRVKRDPRAAISAVLSACKGDFRMAVTLAIEPGGISCAKLFRAITRHTRQDCPRQRDAARGKDAGAGYVAHPYHWETVLQGIVYVLEVKQDDQLEED